MNRCQILVGREIKKLRFAKCSIRVKTPDMCSLSSSQQARVPSFRLGSSSFVSDAAQRLESFLKRLHLLLLDEFL